MCVNPGNWERVAQCYRVFGEQRQIRRGMHPEIREDGYAYADGRTSSIRRGDDSSGEDITEMGATEKTTIERNRRRETNRLQAGAEKSNREERR